MARMIVRLRGPLVSATLGPCAGLWARRHRLRCTGGRMGKRTPCAANEGEMCCGPVVIALPHQLFFKPCCSLGGGFSHTHTTGHHVCCPVRVVLQPTRGRVVGDCEATCKASIWLRGCHLSVFEGCKSRSCVPPQWKERARHSNL